MSKEKKTAEIKEEIKDSAQLTDEQLAEVNGGLTQEQRLAIIGQAVAATPGQLAIVGQVADQLN